MTGYEVRDLTPRYEVVVLPAGQYPAAPVAPRQGWDRARIIAWLAGRGVTGVDGLDTGELLDLARDLLD